MRATAPRIGSGFKTKSNSATLNVLVTDKATRRCLVGHPGSSGRRRGFQPQTRSERWRRLEHPDLLHLHPSESARTPRTISATGYTGSGGVEVYSAAEAAKDLWEACLEQGVVPCGLGARDTLRMEMGFCLGGNDIDESTSPIAAGLGRITKFNKEFMDAETLRSEKEQGSPRRLVGAVHGRARAFQRQG